MGGSGSANADDHFYGPADDVPLGNANSARCGRRLLGKIVIRDVMKHETCKLCLSKADLQQSHYLGRALYRLSSGDGERPILMSPDLVIQDQKQIKDYVLCRNCEQRFTKMGEDYLMKMVNRKDGFRMMELIRANPMRRTEGEYTVYCAAHMGIDTDMLAYFALSVIWRGAHIWPTFQGRATGGLQLGPHEKRLRRYLLGTDPYPRGVLVKMSVACDNASQNFIMFPRINPDQQDATAFTFMVRGIWFDVIVGASLPAYMYRNCCVSSPEKVIFVGDFDRFVTYEIEQSKQTAHIDRKLNLV
jgi:hypothetical protein